MNLGDYRIRFPSDISKIKVTIKTQEEARDQSSFQQNCEIHLSIPSSIQASFHLSKHHFTSNVD